MTLQQKLDDFKAQFESGGPPRNAPKAVIEIFHRATEELRQSGLAERALKTGNRAPTFTFDSQSVIRSANVNADYTVRPEPSETIRVLEQLTNETGIAS